MIDTWYDAKTIEAERAEEERARMYRHNDWMRSQEDERIFDERRRAFEAALDKYDR